jgi:N-methylhydantoinase B
MRRGIRLVAPDAAYSVLADGAVLPAFGVLGGGSGVPVGSHVIRQGRALHFPRPGKVGGFRMLRDDVLSLQSAGGGGYGDPLERPPAQVADDLRQGYISSARGRDRYGVVVRDDGSVDEVATRVLREQLRAQRFHLRIVDAAHDLYRAGAVSRRRSCPMSPADAARGAFADGALVELLGAGAAPLRAWIAVDERVRPGTVPLDALGRRVLSVVSGDPLEIRPL